MAIARAMASKELENAVRSALEIVSAEEALRTFDAAHKWDALDALTRDYEVQVAAKLLDNSKL